MASSTPNLDLTLPVGGENVSRQIINANNVKIDEAVGAVPSGTDLQSQVTALNNNITTLSNNVAKLSANTDAITDCNAITDTGIYKAINSTSNTPASNYHYVIYHATYSPTEKTQYAIRNSDSAMFARVYYNNAWTSWQELARKSDIVVQPCSVPSVNRSGDLNQAISVTYNTSYSSKTNIPIPIGFYLVDGWGGINGHRAYLKNYSKTGVVVDLTFASNDVRNNINFTALSVVLYVRD